MTTMTLEEILDVIVLMDAHLDSAASPEYQAQPLAQDWARVTKPCEEAGEAWRAFSRLTGENPRKGKCGTMDEVLGELGDTAASALMAVQHLVKDRQRVLEVLSAAMEKARARALAGGIAP